jgi:polar amino acid transport system substrate-binding protein
VVAPDAGPVVFDSIEDATQALTAGEVDALVVNYPAAFSITSAQMVDGVVVGQIADSGDSSRQFGLLLQKDSPVAGCVSQAVDALREDGTLADLEKRWLAKAPPRPFSPEPPFGPGQPRR